MGKKSAKQKSAGEGEQSADLSVATAVEEDTEVPEGPSALFGFIVIPDIVTFFFLAALLLAQLGAIGWIVWNAYRIRTFAIKEYGRIIHEFDPWFNYRATRYLAQYGWEKFFHWFDHMSWYPLGRPVGTTIYPGMQIAAVAIYRTMNFLNYRILLNDVCCFIPCWFGSVASVLLGLLTYECFRSRNAAIFATAIFAIVPAHLMRSIGGGYDNESVAVSTMLLTFYLWVRCLRINSHWLWSVFAGAAYVCMVAVWGGYIFVLNLIGAHAGILILVAIFTCNQTSLERIYGPFTIFYIVGTAGAVHVPVVGWAPFKSLEQLAPFIIFIFLQVDLFAQWLCRRRGVKSLTSVAAYEVRFSVYAATGVVLVAIAAILLPTGYFGPLSARVRGLFVPHTHTGNPLVDSVAEHQAASSEAFWQYLHYVYYVAPVGLALVGAKFSGWFQSSFLLVYACAAYYFCLKMVRLLLLAGPIASCLAGIALGSVLDWVLAQAFWPLVLVEQGDDGKPIDGGSEGSGKRRLDPPTRTSVSSKLRYLERSLLGFYNSTISRWARLAIAIAIVVFVAYTCKPYIKSYTSHCESMAHQFSNPQIIYKAQARNGAPVLVDDYRKAYFWLRDNTPKDSRVMAWWDYGYQITGIANRTSIADGNTWNHEHIAFLGRCLTSPVVEAHKVIRHLADYVLVWTGGGGDDLAKSPHMARIGNSVYGDICPGDPGCSRFGFDHQGRPTPMMEKSLLFNMCKGQPNPDLFELVFRSQHDKVRIFAVKRVSRESKDWVADPKNRICDAEGSWYCSGQYPNVPEVQAVLKKRRNFSQLEDFNNRGRR